MLLGTGAPSYAPASCAERPCVPGDTLLIAETIATTKNITVEDVLAAVARNAGRVFGVVLTPAEATPPAVVQ